MLFCPALLLCLAGCNNHSKLEGQVTYSDTGEPLEHGTVNFVTPTFQASGKIGQDGKYVMGSYKEDDGLPKGSYRVYVSDAFRNEDNPKERLPRPVSLIDDKFCSPESSGLQYTVDGSQKRFDIKVDRIAQKKK